MEVFVIFVCLLLTHGFARAQDNSEMERMLNEDSEIQVGDGPGPATAKISKAQDESDIKNMLADEDEKEKSEKPVENKLSKAQEESNVKSVLAEENEEEEDDLEMENMLLEEAEKEEAEVELDEESQNVKPNEQKNAQDESEIAEEALGASSVQTSVIDDITISKASNSVRQCIINDLPQELEIKVRETDDAEEKVLSRYAQSHSAPNEALAAYKQALNNERTFLKDLLPEMGSEAESLLTAYRALRKGKAWNYIQHDERFANFFQQASSALTEYQSLKADETRSLDSFLSSPSQARAAKINKRSLTSEAYLRTGANRTERVQTQEDVFERRVNVLEYKRATDRRKVRIGSDSKTIGLSQEPVDEVSSEKTITKISNAQIIHSNLLVFVILFLLVGQLVVSLVIAKACRKQIAEWRKKNNRVNLDLRQDMESSNADRSPLNAHGTETTALMHSTFSLTSADETTRA